MSASTLAAFCALVGWEAAAARACVGWRERAVFCWASYCSSSSFNFLFSGLR
ncbi:hypothetical protein [Archangium lansingense]|uniref:Secreted protein n=1 Tax=Archangium lansingense TaxID=2995310 RepID=A0ABT4A002_9BACT|nr:hypothetical protein [Archangium lansinium]MCY1074319.1 hypothetical protein [Archangium lansinium]